MSYRSFSGKENKMMLMILSSSTASRFGGRKKCVISKDVEWKGKPLSGIEWDKKRLQ